MTKVDVVVIGMGPGEDVAGKLAEDQPHSVLDKPGGGRGQGSAVVMIVLGGGAIGEEILGMLGLAIHERIPTVRLKEMIFAYPTFYRAVEDAPRDLS